MKKKIAAALAATFALGVTSAFAANPFVDVPAKHWAYDSISKLAKAGIVDGYGDGTFRGDKTMTRYEMAQIVAKALTKEEKANAEQKALLNKLSAEFGTELNNLGVRVSNLEKNQSSVKISADARIRYKENENTAATDTQKFANRLRLYVDGTVSKDISFTGRLVAENGNVDKAAGENDRLAVDYANFTYKNAFNTVNVSAGRFALGLGYGLVSGTTGGYDAVQVAFGGDKVKGWVGYGDNSLKAGKATAADVTTANVVYTPNNDFQLLTSAYVSNTKGYDYSVYSIGAKGKLSPVFTLTGEYAKNNDAAANADDSAYFAQLGYKGANKNVPNSYGVFVQYWKAGSQALDHRLSSLPVFEALTGDAFIRANGIKSLGYGVNYTFSKNAIFTLTYQDLKSYNGSIDRPNYGYARAEFWF